MTNAEARMELVLLESQAEDFGGPEFDAMFTNAGLPLEVALPLRELRGATCRIGNKIIRIGKVILMELARFARESPNLAVGVATGAGIGVLVSLVPDVTSILSSADI